MTPTEIKAEAKATELKDFFVHIVYPYSGSGFMTDTADNSVILMNCVKCAVKIADEMIEELSVIKGMGKIHKLKFWKLVKKYLEE